MGLIDVASGNSVWRGMDYYENKKVISWEKTGDNTYDGKVSGSYQNEYTVHIDKAHPKRSTCTCPFAKGRRVVCKHMIALYFTAEPQAVKDFLKEVEMWEAQQAEERQKQMEERQQHLDEIRKHVNSLTKAQLREELYGALIQLEVDDYDDYDDYDDDYYW